MSGGLLPGPYAWPAFRCKVRQVVTNKTPAGHLPGAGPLRDDLRPRARRRHRRAADRHRPDRAAPPQPHPDRADALRQRLADRRPPGRLRPRRLPAAARAGARALRRAGDAGLARRAGRRPASAAASAVAFFVEKSGIAEWEYARVEIGDDGRPVVFSGSASIGQGVETVLAQVAAETLGLPYDVGRACATATPTRCRTGWAPSAAAPRRSAAPRWRKAAARAARAAARRWRRRSSSVDAGRPRPRAGAASSRVERRGSSAVAYARLRELAGGELSRGDAPSAPTR